MTAEVQLNGRQTQDVKRAIKQTKIKPWGCFGELDTGRRMLKLLILTSDETREVRIFLDAIKARRQETPQ